ncbi:hypothetical protein GLA29479_1858 [Lysobacter antibioticus]|nr:hypothetical protein [Lysobacter antibioticus]ALN62732.1 hypothetical protein GLA29479_1858 [Lysobacter antibioticus]
MLARMRTFVARRPAMLWWLAALLLALAVEPVLQAGLIGFIEGLTEAPP